MATLILIMVLIISNYIMMRTLTHNNDTDKVTFRLAHALNSFSRYEDRMLRFARFCSVCQGIFLFFVNRLHILTKSNSLCLVQK